MDEDTMYDRIDFIRELIYGKDAQKFSQSFNEKITKTTESKFETLYYNTSDFHRKLYKENYDFYTMLFFINLDFILPYDKAFPFIKSQLNNKAKYSKKTVELYSPILNKEVYNEIYAFSSTEKNLNLLDDIILKESVPEPITYEELEKFSIVLKYKIYYLNKFNKLIGNVKSIVENNPNLFTFSNEEITYIFLIYNGFFEKTLLKDVNKEILSMLKIENIEKFSEEREIPSFIIKNINNIIDNNFNVKELNITLTVKAINKNVLPSLDKDISLGKKLKIIKYIFDTDDISEDITLNELRYFGPILRYKIYYLNKVDKANYNIKFLIQNNPELFVFSREEIDNIYSVYHKYRPKYLVIVKILELENIRLVDKYRIYGFISNNLELIKTYKINISDDVKRLVKEEYTQAFKPLEEQDDDEDDFRQEYNNQRPSKVLETISVLDMWDELPEIDFLNYYMFKDKYPKIREQKTKISKDSIIKFLMRSEVSEEDLEDWNEIYKSQYGSDAVPPPPPDWWLLSRSADVHTKKTLNITDCRIKLLLKNNTMRDIQKVAEDIEEETERIAHKHGIEDNEKNLPQYVRNHTITKDTILNCRLDVSKPRYYGFGGIYENDKSSNLAPENRVELCDIVIKVWNVIQSVKHNEEMYETLIAQFVGAFKEHIASGVCNQGWVGGLTSIFGSYSKELGYLCMTIKEEEINQLVYKFLVDMRDDVTVDYPTVSKLFSEISGILLDAKYEDDWDYDSHTKEENESFDKKVKMYDILFEDPTVSKEVKMKTMKEFVECMLPTFFMRSLDYFEEKETIVKIKEASKAAIEDFKQFQLDKICGSTNKRKRS